MTMRMKLTANDLLFGQGVNGGNQAVVWAGWRTNCFDLESVRNAIENFIMLDLHKISYTIQLHPNQDGIAGELYEYINMIRNRREEDFKDVMVNLSLSASELEELTVSDCISRNRWEGLGLSVQTILMIATYKRLILDDREGYGSPYLHLTIAGAAAVSTILGIPVKA